MVENLLHNQCLWICLHTENLPAKVIQNARIYVKVRETIQYAWLKKKKSLVYETFHTWEGFNYAEMWRSSNFMTGGRTKSFAWPSSLRTKSYGISTIHFSIRPFSLSRVKDLKTTKMKNTNNLPVRCPWYLRTQYTVFQAQAFCRQMERGVFFQIRLSYHKESCTT